MVLMQPQVSGLGVQGWRGRGLSLGSGTAPGEHPRGTESQGRCTQPHHHRAPSPSLGAPQMWAPLWPRSCAGLAQCPLTLAAQGCFCLSWPSVGVPCVLVLSRAGTAPPHVHTPVQGQRGIPHVLVPCRAVVASPVPTAVQGQHGVPVSSCHVGPARCPLCLQCPC